MDNLKALHKRAAILLVMLSLLVLSGCVRTGVADQCPVSVSQEEALVVTRFEPSYFEIPVGDQVSLYVDIQNRGTKTAKNVVATLWAHSGFAVMNPQGETIGDGKCFDINGREDLTCSKEICYNGHGMPLPPQMCPSDDHISNFEPPRLDICSMGDARTWKWDVKAGCDPTKTVFSVYVDYDYGSEGSATILMASQEEAEKTQGKENVKGMNQPSAGPLQVLIEPLQSEPVIITPYSTSFDARIKFKNIGNGLVGERGMGGIKTVSVSLKGPCKFRDLQYAKPEVDPSSRPADDKSFSYAANTVLLASGSQEILKIIHLDYDDSFADIYSFVRDSCSITVDADYHYQLVDSTTKTMGVYGTSYQVQECYAGD